MARHGIFIGTDKGGFLLESQNGRKDWQLRGPFLKGWKVFDLMLDQRSEPTLYAAVGHDVYGPALHISRDLGGHFEQVQHGPSYDADSGFKLNNVWTVVPGPKDQPDTLYAGVDEAGLFVSRDRGLHWQELSGLSRHATRSEWVPGAGGLCCHSILIDPDNADRIWVGISAVGVFRSDDGGATWHSKNQGVMAALEMETHKDIGRCVHRLVMDPQNPRRLFQQNHRGVFRSLDGGDSWERIENGLPSSFGFPMAVHPNRPGTLYVAPLESDEYRFFPNGRPAVYRSSDAGDSWQALTNGFPETGYVSVLRHALATDAEDPCGVYFGTTGGTLYTSADEGEHWQSLPHAFPRIYCVSALRLE